MELCTKQKKSVNYHVENNKSKEKKTSQKNEKVCPKLLTGTVLMDIVSDAIHTQTDASLPITVTNTDVTLPDVTVSAILWFV